MQKVEIIQNLRQKDLDYDSITDERRNSSQYEYHC